MNNFKKVGRVLEKTPPTLLKKRILKTIREINQNSENQSNNRV